MNPFFAQPLLSFILFTLFLSDFRDALEAENIVGALIWGALTVLFAVCGVQEFWDWWKNYRGITTNGAVVTDGHVVLKRKIRG